MIDEATIRKQIPLALVKTDFSSLGKRYQGKVRDNYTKDGTILMVTTDRLSAFDHVLGTIPFKGQVLNQMAVFWFQKTQDIINNHLIDSPDPNVMRVKVCKPILLEFVVRGYLTGSLWRSYEKGERHLYGIKFNNGLKKDQKFDQPILTPTTKEAVGTHDQPIAKSEIVSRRILSKDQYEKIEKLCLKLFARGTKIAKEQGLLLVDTKYELGLDSEGNVTLIDEIHTPDSSRYWYSEGYGENFEMGIDQKQLDKEFVRRWLMDHGFSGEGTPPKLPDELKIEAAKRYIEAYELVTGEQFVASAEDVSKRIQKNLEVR